MQDKITLAEIEAAVGVATTFKRPLVIEGYMSQSGSVCDYTVKLIGQDGYRRLVVSSLAALKDVWNPGDYDGETWEKAKSALAESWSKSIMGDHAAKNYSTDPPPADMVVLTHMYADNIFEHVGSTKVVNSALLTLAKRDITLQVPMGKYIGRLNLTPDKIKAIRVGDPCTDPEKNG